MPLGRSSRVYISRGKLNRGRVVHAFLVDRAPACAETQAVCFSASLAISEPHGSQDLTLFVQNLLKEMQSRFQTMSDGIVNRIDDMGNRIDELERY